MAKRGRKKLDKKRDKFTTTLDVQILRKVKAMQFLLQANGEDAGNVNDYIEEGLEMVFEKYKDEAKLEF